MLRTAPIIQSPDWSRPISCHVDSSASAIGGTISEVDELGRDHAVAYFSNRSSLAEDNFSARDLELLSLVYFIRLLRCYLDGSSFEVIIGSDVSRHFFSEPSIIHREAHWLYFLSNFGITKVTQQKGSSHVLGETLSHAPHTPIFHLKHRSSQRLPTSKLLTTK